MTACNVNVIKMVGKYYNVPVGTIGYTSDKVPKTVLDEKNIEGFATIILRLAAKCHPLNQEENLSSYQWLEYTATYANQAAVDRACAKEYLESFNRYLENSSYLTGNFLAVTDIAVYYVLYPLIERLSLPEKESLLALCRWFKHIQAQPNVCSNIPPLPLNILSLKTPTAH